MLLEGDPSNRKPFPGWPTQKASPRTILVINISPHDLSKRFALDLVRDEDQLDSFYACHIVDDVIGPIVFILYDGLNKDYLEEDNTYCEVDNKTNISIGIDRIKSLLDFKDRNIIWMHPDYTQSLENTKNINTENI